MFFKQYYLGCLAHASYMIGSQGKAIVVDPQRDVDEYIKDAAEQNLKITHVIETHLHADFVSGHIELAERTGAQIVVGAVAHATFDHHAVREGDEITLDGVRVQVIETPGHTPESISLLVFENDKPEMILTGDAMFIGDVGRPDLAGGAGFTAQDMASMMYDTIHSKFLSLPDDVMVYPAHGAGSMCGRSISRERSSTIGEQRKMNYALQPMSREEFVTMMTSDLPEQPQYFSTDAEINRSGARPLQQIERPKAMTPSDVTKAAENGAVVLDVRPAPDYGAGHVPGALHIGLSGEFASWAGTLIKFNTPIILVGEDDSNVDEATMRLARVGIESVIGYLDGGMSAWFEAGLAGRETPQVTVFDLHDMESTDNKLNVLDVRRDSEFETFHIPEAKHVTLAQLSKLTGDLNPSSEYAVICASGYRSSIASSVLERSGFSNIINVVGGANAWKRAGFEVATPH